MSWYATGVPVADKQTLLTSTPRAPGGRVAAKINWRDLPSSLFGNKSQIRSSDPKVLPSSCMLYYTYASKLEDGNYGNTTLSNRVCNW